MTVNQRTNNKYTAFSRVFRCAGWLLLTVFLGRVALVTAYGYAGVPKYSVTASSNDENQDDDKKDENKYTEKQFKYISQEDFMLLVPVYININKPSFTLKTGFTALHVLAVPTPPPNC